MPRSIMRLVQRKVAMVIALAVACVGFVGAASAPAGAKSLTTVRVEYAAGINLSATTVVAQDQGYFKQNGLKVQLLPGGTSANQIAALISGSADATQITSDSALQAMAQGQVSMKAVGGQFTNFWELIGGPSVCASGTKFPADLKSLEGQTLGVPGLGSAPYYLMQAFFGARHITGVNMENVQFGTPAVLAVESGQVAAYLGDPGIAVAVLAAKKGCVLANLAAPGVLPSSLAGKTYGPIWLTSSFISAHPGATAGFQRSFIEATLWEKNPKNFSAFRTLLGSIVGSTYTGAQLTLLAHETIADETTYITPSAIKAWYQFDVNYKLIQSPVANFKVSNYLWSGAAQSPGQAKSIADKS